VFALRVSCAVLCLWAVVFASGPAQAQGRLLLAQTQLTAADLEARNTTMARALFDEGLRFVDMEQWREAEDRFSRVLTLRYSAVAAYNLGLAQARLGRSVVAAASLRRMLNDSTLDTKVRDRTTGLLTDVESQFAWLNVRVAGECPGCSVYLNEQEWPWAVVGVSVPVDAGQYALRLRISDRVLAEQRLELAPASRAEATLTASPQTLDDARHGRPGGRWGSAPDAATAGTGASRTRSRSILKSGFFWSAVGVLAVGAITALVLESQ
jgi:hypothetical protein